MLGVVPGLNVSVEKDGRARRTAQSAWPDQVHFDDVTLVTAEEIRKWKQLAPSAKWLLCLCGSPCVDLSSLKSGRRGLEGSQSSLFYEIARIVGIVKEFWPSVTVVLIVENVASMDAKDRRLMTEELQLDIHYLESSEITDCRRPRLYWWDNKLFAPWYGQITMWKDVPWLHLPGGRGEPSRWLTPGSAWPHEKSAKSLPTLVRALPRKSPPPDPRGIDRCNEAELSL